jgi:peptidoglycan/xylan/chitin deacetylase (PgdA/CDA1 family)
VLAVKENCRNSDGRAMLNWNEVIEMSRHNISFGAHTVTQPIQSKMDVQEAKREIYESKMEVEAQIGVKVEHFAIPNGKVKDFNEELKKYCMEIGLKTVVSTEPGVISAQSDPYLLERIYPSPPIYLSACELARYMFFGKRRANTPRVFERR